MRRAHPGPKRYLLGRRTGSWMGPPQGEKGSKGGPSLADPLADLAYRGTSLATGVPKQPL